MERNPSVEQMHAAAAVAAAKYPQVTSLDDPVLGFSTAPFSAGSPNTDYAARIEIGQKFLYPGKRGLKGTAALAEAGAATRDVEDVRLQLVESAKAALADYFAAEKGRGVAEENLRLLAEFKRNAESRYANGLATQQDVTLGEVELARQQERLVAYRRAERVAVARINTLMHRAPDAALPRPADLRDHSALPELVALRAQALTTRPDLKALADRITADQATLALTLREYHPDIEVFAAYDGFWQGQSSRPLQWQAGMRMALPTRYARRDGATAEAQAKLAQRRAELTRLSDQVLLQVQEAYEQVRGARVRGHRGDLREESTTGGTRQCE